RHWSPTAFAGGRHETCKRAPPAWRGTRRRIPQPPPMQDSHVSDSWRSDCRAGVGVTAPTGAALRFARRAWLNRNVRRELASGQEAFEPATRPSRIVMPFDGRTCTIRRVEAG